MRLGSPLKEPDVRTRAGQIDMAQTFASHFRLGNFNAALVADHAAVLHAFVFSAETFPISDWTKNARAEKSIAFGFEGAVVDRFWLGHLTMRPLPDLFR